MIYVYVVSYFQISLLIVFTAPRLGIERLRIERLRIELPGVELSGVERTGVELPRIELPGVEPPGVELPRGRTPQGSNSRKIMLNWILLDQENGMKNEARDQMICSSNLVNLSAVPTYLLQAYTIFHATYWIILTQPCAQRFRLHRIRFFYSLQVFEG
jgi:hypothetical protein